MSMRFPILRFIMVVLAISFAATVWAQQMEIIHLKHKTADQILPAIQPLVEQGGGISAFNNSLYLRTSASNKRDIMRAIAAMDVPSRRLRVSLRVAASRDIDAEGLGVGGQVRSGDVSVNVPPSPSSRRNQIELGRINGPSGSVSVDGYSTRDARQSTSLQQVMVEEGGSAFVQSGTSVPVPLVQYGYGPNGRRVVVGTEYRDMTSGFYVKPNLTGDRVTVEVSPQRESAGLNGDQIDSVKLSTTVSGRVGEWMELGGVDSSEDRRVTGVGNYSTRSNLDGKHLQIKVEILE